MKQLRNQGQNPLFGQSLCQRLQNFRERGSESRKTALQNSGGQKNFSQGVPVLRQPSRTADGGASRSSLQLDTDVYQSPRGGLLLLQFAIVFLFVVFCSRFWYLQIHRGAEYARMAHENRIRTERLYAPRGEIFDRNGVLLAENRISFGIALQREDCPDIPAALAQVSAWTGVPYDKVVARYEYDKARGRIFDPVYLVTDLPFETVAAIESELYRWPGLQIITRPRRNYPEREIFAHVLGYVAEATTEELQTDPDLALGDTVGRQGLESVLESRLRGKKGTMRLEVDVLGRPLNRELVQGSRGGENITLNLDARLQRAIMEAMGNYSGAVVVMDPDTGELLALVTQPSYDNNIFVGTLSQKDWNALRNNPRYPLQNRAIQSVYPPGSVWKLMMAGMLLEHGVSPTETVFCPGQYTLGNRTFRCWRSGGHGRVDLAHSLMWSCDVYYYSMGERLGIDSIESFAKACGYGATTGIDLPHENAGLVPSKNWKQQRFGERWQGGETVNTSIGQGYTLVTPLQTAVFISSLLNGGHLLKPQLIKGEPVEIRKETPLSENSRRMIKEFMRQTVAEQGGTAKVLKRPDLTIGGKTGTAQVVKVRMVGNRREKTAEMEFLERDHAWIASWAEKDGKRLVVVTMLEHGGGGSSTAGPVTKAVYEILFPPEVKEETK